MTVFQNKKDKKLYLISEVKLSFGRMTNHFIAEPLRGSPCNAIVIKNRRDLEEKFEAVATL
jgi:hypothetical protein